MKPKSYKIIWDRNALQDFKLILKWLASQSVQAPAIVKQGILQRIEVLKINPYVFETDKLREPSTKDFRAFVIYSYRITYQINFDSHEICIIRVRHTSREPLGY